MRGVPAHAGAVPACCVPRRSCNADVIGAALLGGAVGLGHRKVAAQLQVPAATVRDWLRGVARGAAWLKSASSPPGSCSPPPRAADPAASPRALARPDPGDSVNTATAENWATAISDTPRQREHLPGTVHTSQPASARFAQSYAFTANDAFMFIFSVGGQPGAADKSLEGQHLGAAAD